MVETLISLPFSPALERKTKLFSFLILLSKNWRLPLRTRALKMPLPQLSLLLLVYNKPSKDGQLASTLSHLSGNTTN